MSTLNAENRISVGSFSNLPAIANLPAIERPRSASSRPCAQSATSHVISPDEPCLITKAISYTHECAHWINAVQNDTDRQKDVEGVLIAMSIVDEDFTLDDACNLCNLDSSVHKSLDSYALIAVTASSQTLKELSEMVKADNDKRQRLLDTFGREAPRVLDLALPAFLKPQYELVVLHPEHFLVAGSILTRYDPAQGSHKTYVPSPDRRLRESPGDTTQPSFSPFSGPERAPCSSLNPFLVVINAQIKFKSYRRLTPPAQSLPEDVLKLMKQTEELVELLYWKPVPKPGSEAEILVQTGQGSRRKNVTSKRGLPWPEDADLKTRMEIGTALLSDRNLEFTSEDEDFLESFHNHGYSAPDDDAEFVP